VSSLPCREVDGLIWVWPGKKVPTPIPTAAAVPTGMLAQEFDVFLVVACPWVCVHVHCFLDGEMITT
jgi:hypothetical protein